MAHNKLSALVIDCQAHTLESAVDFWSQALHLKPDSDDQDDRYRSLTGGGIDVLIQKVEWPSSYHMDIEADDVDAEAERLEALGAVKKRKVKSWWVMRAPTGHDFCIIRRQG